MLEVRIGEQRWTVAPGRRFTIGRDPAADATVEHGGLSRLHLTLEPTPYGWLAVDTSSNGTYYNGHRVKEKPLQGAPVTLFLGSPQGGVPVQFANVATGPQQPPPVRDEDHIPTTHVDHPSRPNVIDSTVRPNPVVASQVRIPAQQPSQPHRPVPPPPHNPTRVHQAGMASKNVLRIGRMPDGDVVLTDLPVSRRHAELRREPDGWYLIDLRSPNGSYVNGQRVNRARIGPQDVIGIGRHQLKLVGDRLEEYVDTGEGAYVADTLIVEVDDGKRILDQVGFSLPGRSLMAVVGPSGAGKSTLLGALTGFRPADRGTVTYGGRDLYENYDELRQRIGLVPQDDILHPQLTVRKALEFAAKLRFPEEVTAVERARRIDEVLGQLGLTRHAHQKITSLSGGQRKRTSVALELLTKPSLLFLDEPTSGLDPGMDKSVMHTLRELADDGRTVIVVTHNVSHLDVCDRLLVLAAGGKLAYFGPPSEALEYFGQPDFPEVFLLLDRQREYDWSGRFRASPYFAKYCTPATPVMPQAAGHNVPRAASRQQSALSQFWVLCRRYLAVIAADKQYAIFLPLLPIVLAGLALIVPDPPGLSMDQAVQQGKLGGPGQLLLVLITGGALMGSFASVRELVKERAIYRRERAIGLSAFAYLASKVVVMGVIVTIQGIVLAVVGNLGRSGPDEGALLGGGFEIIAAVVMVTFVSMVIGLLISALIDNADRGMPLLVVVVMVQLLFSSGLFPMVGRPVLEQVSWLVPSRWTYAMSASTVDMNRIKDVVPGDKDALWDHEAGVWIADFMLAGVLGLVLLGLCIPLIKRLDPEKKATAGFGTGGPGQMMYGARPPQPGVPPNPWAGRR